MKMTCPKCNRKYPQNHRFCAKCAVKLERDYNGCNSPRSIDCERHKAEDDDIVCSYCGSVTTYENERIEKLRLQSVAKC